MNKTLEFYRKLAEAYKEHGFEDYAVSELWAALEKAVLANTELVEALQECLSIHGHTDEQVWREGAWRDAPLESWEVKATEAIRKHKGD